MSYNKVKVNHLIALCHIIDGYNDFRKDIIEACVLPSDKNYWLYGMNYDDAIVNKFENLFTEINKCYKNDSDISNFDLSIYPEKIQSCYLKYKDIFYTIEKFTNGNLLDFMSPIIYKIKYDRYTITSGNDTTAFMLDTIENFNCVYDYILSHQENLDKMLAVLNRIQQLDFDELEFNENIDFTSEKMYMYTNFSKASSIPYLDNIIALPTDDRDCCMVLTTGSNYMITIFNLDKREYLEKQIVVNSLVFDENRLPEKISKKNTFDKIINVYNEQNEDIITINELAELYPSIFKHIESASNELIPIDEGINQLNDIETKGKLLELLSRIKVDLEEFKNSYFKIETDLAEKNSMSQAAVALLNKINIEETKERETQKKLWNYPHMGRRKF